MRAKNALSSGSVLSDDAGNTAVIRVVYFSPSEQASLVVFRFSADPHDSGSLASGAASVRDYEESALSFALPEDRLNDLIDAGRIACNSPAHASLLMSNEWKPENGDALGRAANILFDASDKVQAIAREIGPQEG
ncbi:MAG: hypothetical protein HUU21_09495 [Polyangiaceae bacterium]|nr:hypothetical protein [Polyangiaceae bacterium]